MLLKNPNLIIFQSPFQTKLFMKYSEIYIYGDDTFYIAPKFSYQVFITRTYIKDLNGFYTTYEILFKEIKKKKKDANKYSNNTIIIPKKIFSL